MEMWEIEGGLPLRGEVRVSRAKNAVLPQMAAALLTEEPVRILEAPELTDVGRMAPMLLDLGCSVSSEGGNLEIRCAAPRIAGSGALEGHTRASVLALGPLLARCGEAHLALPGGCPLGERIRAMLLDTGSEGMTAECEALLFAASRAQHTATVLRPALQGGGMVLADRYVDSSMAYQGAGRGLGMEAVRGINRMATRGLEPDMTLLYRLDPERARARRQGEDDRIERERSEFHRRVCEGFDELMRSEPGRVRALDATLAPDALFERTRALAMELLARDAQRLKEKGTIARGGASNN